MVIGAVVILPEPVIGNIVGFDLVAAIARHSHIRILRNERRAISVNGQIHIASLQGFAIPIYHFGCPAYDIFVSPEVHKEHIRAIFEAENENGVLANDGGRIRPFVFIHRGGVRFRQEKRCGENGR